MHIVIISGLPCSGKSTVAERLQAQLHIPLLSKDIIKEAMFDALGAKDREWSRRLSRAAYEILFRHAEELVRGGSTFLLEGNFREHQHREALVKLQSAGAKFVQVHCHAESSMLVARFTERAKSGTRHVGHADIGSLSEIEAEMRSTVQVPLSIDSFVIDCDTTGDWSSAIDSAVAAVLEYVRKVRGEIAR